MAQNQGKTIIITEKPSVAQEYRKVLKVTSSSTTKGYIEGYSSVINKEIIITWAVGHLVSICPPERQNEAWAGAWKKEKLPMIPAPYKYAPLKASYDQYVIVKSLYLRNDIKEIYYAGDSGREGIYIQALIRNQIFKSGTRGIDEKVVWIDSFTEESILNGIRNAKPYTAYTNMIDSGYMRAISDWLIGMNFTEGFTLMTGNKSVVNVGRVMTPTLAMVVQRQKEIDEFTKTPYFGIRADDFATWKAIKGSRYFGSDELYNETGFLHKPVAHTLADTLNTDRRLTVESTKIQTKTEYAPYLFNLADLQAKCSKAFHISPAQTLEIAQSLYEKKYTTYPRTDCRFLSSAVAEELKKTKGYDIPKRYIDDSKITDHYALIPTFQGDVDKLSDLEKKVYLTILKRFTDTLLPPYIYDAVSVLYRHSSNEYFVENYRLVKQNGFKEKNADAEQGSSENEDRVYNKPVPEKGSVVNVNAFSIKELETKPPVPYTTGSLILAMEKAGKLIEDEELREQIKTSGIGTSATRANIIEKLKAKNFITVDKKQKIAPTEAGKSIIPLIAKYDQALVSPIKTADMENRLTAIADGELPKDDYLRFIEKYVTDTTNAIIASGEQTIAGMPDKSESKDGADLLCPCCGAKLKHGKYGWFCDCKFSVHNEICGHKISEKDIADITKKGKTRALTFRSKAGKQFKAHLVLDKEKKTTIFEFVNDWK